MSLILEKRVLILLRNRILERSYVLLLCLSGGTGGPGGRGEG